MITEEQEGEAFLVEAVGALWAHHAPMGTAAAAVLDIAAVLVSLSVSAGEDTVRGGDRAAETMAE